jgi:APA family basic amino acid/polyamine antiporter
MISAAHFVILSSARVYFAMARDGVFFRRLGVIHPRFNTPAFALVVGSLAGATLAMLGTVQQLLSYVVFIGWIFYGLGAVSLIIFRRTRPDVDRPFRVPAYPVAPLLFAFAALALVINTIFTQSPKETVLGLGLVALGLPAYAAWRRG